MIKSDKEKLLSSYMEVWILYVLRTFSDDEHPMTVNEISEKITALTQLGEDSVLNGKENPIIKTVSRRLQELEAMGDLYNLGSKENYAEAAYRVMGGQIKALNTRPVSYYFDPILSGGDVSMICAAIESNHYLSPEETEYLVRRENAVCSYREGEKEYFSYRKEKGSSGLPRRPEKSSDLSVLPSRSSVTLEKFTVLQYAITHQLMVKVIPGTYVADNGNIRFAPKNDKESVLNPYALICQNGQYYIVVTHEGYTNPTHYRVDRLFSVRLIENEGNARYKYRKREDVPVKLQKYFKGKKFDADMYTSKYPLMSYYGSAGIQRCEFVCRKDAVTVPIDHFGVGESVKMEELEQDDGYVKFSVFADYDNVKMFCVQHYTIVRPVSPENLKTDVINDVQNAIDEMDRFV